MRFQELCHQLSKRHRFWQVTCFMQGNIQETNYFCTFADLFAFDGEGPPPRLTTHALVQKVGHFPIRMPTLEGVRNGEKVNMTIRMYFGLTEIKIECIIRDKTFVFTSAFDASDSYGATPQPQAMDYPPSQMMPPPTAGLVPPNPYTLTDPAGSQVSLHAGAGMQQQQPSYTYNNGSMMTTPSMMNAQPAYSNPAAAGAAGGYPPSMYGGGHPGTGYPPTPQGDFYQQPYTQGYPPSQSYYSGYPPTSQGYPPQSGSSYYGH